MDPISTIAAIPGIGPALPWIIAAVTLSAALAPLLPPPPKADGVYATFYAVVNFVALNMGHAKNATTPTTQETKP